MLSHDNLIQANNLISKAQKDITKAKGLIDRSIVIDADGSTAPDPNYSYWAALSTALGTVITDLGTASGDVYFYPEQVHG